MHSHEHCGKCGAGELVMVPATPGQHSHIVVGERVLQTIAVTTYVCTQCGFVEQWVNDKADLLVLKSEWGSRARGSA